MNVIIVKLAMKAPKAVLVPAGIVGSALQDGLKMVPVLGGLDVTSFPVVGPFVAGVRAAGAAVSMLESTAAPFASVRAGAEAPIGAISAALVETARDETEYGKLEVTKEWRGPNMGKKHSMPLPDWF